MKYLKKYMLPVSLCIIVDQLVKIIIYNHFFQEDFNVIGSFIRFRPIINTNLSWGGNYIAIFRHFEFVIVINIIAIILFIAGFLFYKYKRTAPTFIAEVVFTLGLSGCLCSLIDKVIWKGSLDYIQITGFFTFDIKDTYLTIFEVIFIFLVIKYRNEISTKEFFRWLLSVTRKDIS